jgi:hypothetical protein
MFATVHRVARGGQILQMVCTLVQVGKLKS